jgi:hypothetical protein
MTSKGGGMTSKGAGRRPGGVEGFRIMSYELSSYELTTNGYPAMS